MKKVPTGVYEHKPTQGFQNGYTPWNKGLTKETDERMRKMAESSKGQHRSPETEFKTGHKMPQELIEKIAKYNRENPNSGQFKKGDIPVNKFEIGHDPWNKGGKLSVEHRRKLSEAHKGQTPWNKGKIVPQIRGENHWKWRGGVSDRGYGLDWTPDLRHSIRARDNYTCQECGLSQNDLYKLDVHHIDEDKKNNIPENLITLCRSCHVHIHSEILLMARAHSRVEGLMNKSGTGVSI